jgi:hypothetical protein
VKAEISAVFRPATQEPAVRYRSGEAAHYLATGASTYGSFGLYRWETGPEPSGPDPHFHRTMSESGPVLTA